MNILLTNPNYKHTWILALHLYRSGHCVYCLSKSKVNFLYFSRFVKKIIIVNSFSKNDYKAACKKYLIDLVIPVGFEENLNISRYSDDQKLHQITNTPGLEKIILASDKYKITTYVSNIGALVPKTFRVNDIAFDKDNIFENKTFFIKPSNEGLIKKYFIIRNHNDLNRAKKFFSKLNYSDNDLILQEFIEGQSVGYFAICENGESLAEYSHKRIREWPKKGGYSTACKIYNNSELSLISRKIIKSLNWHGPIMIEFKRDVFNGNFYFIEINPKLWGSLELGFVSGINILPALFSLSGLNFSNENLNSKSKVYTSIAWPFEGDAFHYLSHPNIMFSLFKKNLIISTGLLRDPLYGLLKLAYFPIKFIREYRL